VLSPCGSQRSCLSALLPPPLPGVEPEPAEDTLQRPAQQLEDALQGRSHPVGAHAHLELCPQALRLPCVRMTFTGRRWKARASCSWSASLGKGVHG
jgi:hypothetical protein